MEPLAEKLGAFFILDLWKYHHCTSFFLGIQTLLRIVGTVLKTVYILPLKAPISMEIHLPGKSWERVRHTPLWTMLPMLARSEPFWWTMCLTHYRNWQPTIEITARPKSSHLQEATEKPLLRSLSTRCCPQPIVPLPPKVTLTTI